MGQRNGFKNLQIQCKADLVELYEDTYTQSGANSKAEFLRILLDSYLTPEESDPRALKNAEESLKIAKEENQKLSARLNLYETDTLNEILVKHKGETVSVPTPGGEKRIIEIRDLPDVFNAILYSVRIK